MKQVIFNVGAGFSSFLEIGDTKILVDLGSSSEYSPIKEFLIPLYEKRKYEKNSDKKYTIDQLFISHPHNDHLSAIQEFDNNFYAALVTTPNDNEGMKEEEKINWDLIKNPSEEYVKILRKKLIDKRLPPLRSSHTSIYLGYIPPSFCEKSKELAKDNYANNISLVLYLNVNNHRIFMPGDLMKDGMEYIIKNNMNLRKNLTGGVDILIAPHHGLRSSFSVFLFDHIKDKKTKRLNIISEKPSTEESPRVVDTRYSSGDYCEGDSNLSTKTEKVYQVKTSNGHIFIDYSEADPFIKVIDTDKTKELIKLFG